MEKGGKRENLSKKRELGWKMMEKNIEKGEEGKQREKKEKKREADWKRREKREKTKEKK